MGRVTKKKVNNLFSCYCSAAHRLSCERQLLQVIELISSKYKQHLHWTEGSGRVPLCPICRRSAATSCSPEHPLKPCSSCLTYGIAALLYDGLHLSQLSATRINLWCC